MIEILLTRVIVQTKATLPLNLATGLSILMIAVLVGILLIPERKRETKNKRSEKPKSCKYYSGSHILKCAVNPHLPCDDCKDFDPI